MTWFLSLSLPFSLSLSLFLSLYIQILHNLIGSNEFTEYQQQCMENNANISLDKIVLTLQEWMEIAQDLIEEYQDRSIEEGGFQEEDLQLYQQFAKVAKSIISLVTSKDKKK
jgi:enolase